MKTAVHIHAVQTHSGGRVALRCELTYDAHVVAKWTATVDAAELGALDMAQAHRLFGAVRTRLTMDLNQLALFD